MTYVFTDLAENATFEDFREEYRKYFGDDYYEFRDAEDIPTGKIKGNKKESEWVDYNRSEDCVAMWEDDFQNKEEFKYFGKKVTSNRFKTKFELCDDAEFEYLSHINGMKCNNPNNWVSCSCRDSDDVFSQKFKAWYYVDDTNTELDDINYSSPDFVENENGEIVYSF